MKLIKDVILSAEDILEIISKFNNDEHIDDEDLHQFQNDEQLVSLSQEDLKIRLNKHVGLDVDRFALFVTKQLNRNDLVRLSHLAISVANANAYPSVPTSSKRNANEDSREVSAKKQKTVEPIVSFI